MTQPQRPKAHLCLLLCLLCLSSALSASSNCSWSLEVGGRRQSLSSCFILLAESDVDSDSSLRRSPYDPGAWLPRALRPPGAWPQPLLLKDLTLQLASCAPLWTLTVKACTFRSSWAWPSTGLKAGPAFLFFRHLVSSTVTAERLTVTCPLGDWEALLMPGANNADDGTTNIATTPTAGLAPCGTATVTTGQQLLEALEALQPGHARLLITVAANISLPAEPTPQREFNPPDDSQPLVRIYRNVTLAGAAAAITPSFNDDGTRGGTGTELNVRKRRNIFGITRAVAADNPQQLLQDQQLQQRPLPVLVMADMTVVNSPPGPPSTWPLGLLTMFQYYSGLNRSGSAGLQLLALRARLVYNPGQIGYMNYWYALTGSFNPEDRQRAAWLRRLVGAIQYVSDEDGWLCSWTGMADYFTAYNSTVTPLSLLTPPTPNDYDLWSLEPPGSAVFNSSSGGGGSGGSSSRQQQQSAPLPPGSFAVAVNTSQLLGLMQEPWSGGPRVILVVNNLTLQPGEWPKDGVALSYNLSLVGPVAGPPLRLDTGGLPLVKPYNQQQSVAATASGGGTNPSGSLVAPSLVVLQLLRLRLVGLPTPPLRASRADVAAADGKGAFMTSHELMDWRARCLQEGGGMGTGQPTVLLYDLRSCVLEVKNGACDTYTNGSTTAAGGGAAGTAGNSRSPGAETTDGSANPLCNLLLANSSTGSGAGGGAGWEGPRLTSALKEFLVNLMALAPLAYTPLLNISAPPLSATFGSGVSMSFQSCSLEAVPGEAGGSSRPSLEAGAAAGGAAAATNDDNDSQACTIDSLLLAIYHSSDADQAEKARKTAVVVGIAVGSVLAALLFVGTAAGAAFIVHRRRRGHLYLKRQQDGLGFPAHPPPADMLDTSNTGCGVLGGGAAAAAIGIQISGGNAMASAASRRDGVGGGTPNNLAACGSPALTVLNMDDRKAAPTETTGPTDGGNLRFSMSLNFSNNQASTDASASGRETMADMLLRRPTSPMHATAGRGSRQPPAAAAAAAGATVINVRGPRGAPRLPAGAPDAPQQQDGAATAGAADGDTAGDDDSIATGVAASSGNLQATMNEEIEVLLKKCRATVAQASGSTSSGSGRRQLQLLGRGAFGAVYLGVWRGLPAAIKVVVFQPGDSDERRKRLVREAALTSALSHPNVVPTYHFEVEAVRATDSTMAVPSAWALENGAAVDAAAGTDTDIAALRLRLAMQYCEGGTLSEALRKGLFGVLSYGTASGMQQRKALATPPQAPSSLTGQQQLRAAETEGQSGSNDAEPQQPAAAGQQLQAAMWVGPHSESGAAGAKCQGPAGLPPARPAAPQRLNWGDLVPAFNLPLSLLAALDVLRGLEYLHSHNVIHGDLTDNNVLLKAVQPVLPGPPRIPHQAPAAGVGPTTAAAAGDVAAAAAADDRLEPCSQRSSTAPGTAQATGRLGSTPAAAEATSSMDTRFITAGHGSIFASRSSDLDHGAPLSAGPATSSDPWVNGQRSALDGACHHPGGGPRRGFSAEQSSASTNPIMACMVVDSTASGTAGTVTRCVGSVSSEQQQPQPAVPLIHGSGDWSSVGLGKGTAACQLLCYVFKISDFGLSAQLQGDSQSHLSNMIQGTPFFVAPEVVHVGRLSPAADIYSFGVLLWLLLHGVSLMQLRHLLPRLPHVPIGQMLLRHTSPDLPRAARELLRRCLDQQPAQRPTAGHLLASVEDLLREVAGQENAQMLLRAERKEHFWPTSSRP